MDKGQQIRFCKDEIELINKFTNSREDAVVLLRNHFLQLELKPDEQKFLDNLEPEFLAVLEKMIIPDLTTSVPVTQEATLYSRLINSENLHPEMFMVQIQANDLMADYCRQQFKLLTVKEEPTIILKELKEPLGVDQNEIRVVNMIAYNNVVPLIENRLNVLNGLTIKPTETEEEIAKRKKADSSK